jgi:putative SOS response-associated peptidase YedK
VITDGFYEIGDEAMARPPWRFSFGQGRELMLLAGIWESWRPLGAREPLHTYCILTTRANPAVAEVHHRMPVILGPQDWSAWLNPLTPAESLTALLRPWPEPLHGTPVTPRVRDPLFEGRECHEPHERWDH